MRFLKHYRGGMVLKSADRLITSPLTGLPHEQLVVVAAMRETDGQVRRKTDK